MIYLVFVVKSHIFVSNITRTTNNYDKQISEIYRIDTKYIKEDSQTTIYSIVKPYYRYTVGICGCSSQEYGIFHDPPTYSESRHSFR